MEEKKAKMLKFIMGKGHQPSAERLKVQKELFGFNRVRISHWNFLLLLWLFMASLHYFYGSVRISKLSKLENEYSTSLPKKYPNLSIDEKTRQSLFTNIQFDGFFISQKNQNWRKSSWKFVYIVTKQCRTFFNLTDFLPKKNQNSNFKTVNVNSHNLIHSEKLRIDILLWVIQVLFDFSI